MTYIVSQGSTTKRYEAEAPYQAVQKFMREMGLTSLDEIFVRAFGGTDTPASKIWPRRR